MTRRSKGHNRATVATWRRGYQGGFVTRRDWPTIAERVGVVASLLVGAAVGVLASL